MLQSHLHVLHSSIQVADLPNLLPLSLKVLEPNMLLPLGGLWLDTGSNNWQTYYFLKVHVPFSIYLDLEVVDGLLLMLELLEINHLPSSLILWYFSSFLLNWNPYLFGHQKVTLSFRWQRRGSKDGFSLNILVGNFFVDDLDGSLEDESQFKYSGIVVVYLIQLQDECLTDFVDPEIVPLAPSSIIPQLLLPCLAVNGLNLLELLHELQVDGPDVGCGSELGSRECLAL